MRALKKRPGGISVQRVFFLRFKINERGGGAGMEFENFREKAFPCSRLREPSQSVIEVCTQTITGSIKTGARARVCVCWKT